MSEARSAGSRPPRGSYSRLICLGCRERRIRCELPSEVEIPDRGELRRVETPCYRCRRLDIPCIVRQTVLGRPGSSSTAHGRTKRPIAAADSRPASTRSNVSRIIIQVPSRTEPYAPSSPTLLVHYPHSTDTVIIIRALDTLRCEHVEKEWFRHLPAHYGHTRALDLSIKAIVIACEYARGVPKLKSRDCYQALALALNAVQTNIKQAHEKPDDAILASTALLAPFEGVVKKNGVPTRLHVEGLAAILVARPATYAVTPLAREIIDFNACESGVMACIQDKCSPFENVSRAYFANDRTGYSDSDQAQLKALATELFIRIPRLLGFVRSLQLQPSPPDQLRLDALTLLESLLELQDPQAEKRLLQNVKVTTSSDLDVNPLLSQNLYFAAVKDFEALAYYWQGRLSLLRLQWRLHALSVPNNVQIDGADAPGFGFQLNSGPGAAEMFRLAKNILMCLEYARTLVLNKHIRLFAHAVVMVWGTMVDMPMAFSQHQNEQGTYSVPDQLLQTVNIALKAKPGLTTEEMDTAADLFAGGQPRGRFAQLYGL